MKCSYHPEIESQEYCSTCGKPLCVACVHRIRARTYCEDCLAQAGDWMAAFKSHQRPKDAPQRAALLSLIPGMGAVYNNEYLKGVTYFAVFACLILLGDRIHGIFGFGSFVFLVFTMVDSYRTAQTQTLRLLETPRDSGEPPQQEKAVLVWGIALIVLGLLFLLQNFIPFYYLNRLWPLAFVLLGGYLVYRALHEQKRPNLTRKEENR